MKKSAILLSAAFQAASSLWAALPAREDVFSIGIYSPPEHNLVSRDFIFTGLPDYREIDRAAMVDYPSHKTAATQHGVIVLKDKSVLFFETRSPDYLLVVDSANRSTYYRLAKPVRAKLECPRPEKNLADMEFPKPDEIFCVALFPWNQGKQFRPETLVQTLPKFRLLTKNDVPDLASSSQMGNTGRIIYTPAEWMTPAGRAADVLNGVIVMKNRAVLKWITWSPTALAFQNHRQGSYYVISR
ncbi:hypothetical protein JIN84_22785 [Luteolibacter yonseiensis]|uniref:Uncharacterized protein n=1 Tax=Luteolibacter yonseiensis TaxID=1144680 RepID=A0A934R4V7_9BACT|nr:hypothetical protein [Luteolibacter yonseiensis]MBK1818463.1 hypothetical protein [Luteolibacter yonseiensis]